MLDGLTGLPILQIQSWTNGGADLSFSCKVDYSGRIVDLDLDRRGVSYGYNNGYYRGY